MKKNNCQTIQPVFQNLVQKIGELSRGVDQAKTDHSLIPGLLSIRRLINRLLAQSAQIINQDKIDQYQDFTELDILEINKKDEVITDIRISPDNQHQIVILGGEVAVYKHKILIDSHWSGYILLVDFWFNPEHPGQIFMLDNNGSMELYDYQKETVETHFNRVPVCDFLPQKNLVLATNEDKLVIWKPSPVPGAFWHSLPSDKKETSFTQAKVRSAKFHPHQSEVIILVEEKSGQRDLEIWDYAQDTRKAIAANIDFNKFNNIQFLQNGQYLAIYNSEEVKIIDYQKNQLLSRFSFYPQTEGMQDWNNFTFANQLPVVAIWQSNTIKHDTKYFVVLYNYLTSRPLKTIHHTDFDKAGYALTFSPDDQNLYISDGKQKIYQYGIKK